MEIRRDFYLDKLVKRKNNGLIKIITGIRRCGKSYLLNNLFYHHLLDSGVDANHIIRFAFDSADDLYLMGESLIRMGKEKRGADPEEFMAYVRSKVVDDGMYYLLLDEIQMLDCFEAVLNSYLRNLCQSEQLSGQLQRRISLSERQYKAASQRSSFNRVSIV